MTALALTATHHFLIGVTIGGLIANLAIILTRR